MLTGSLTNYVSRITHHTSRPKFIVLGAVLLSLVLARGFLLREQDQTWDRIQRDRIMRVGLDPSFPPFEVDNAGQFEGYDVDLAHALGNRWGIASRFVAIGFDGLIDGLLAEQYDIIMSAFPYDPRLTQDVAYSEPYFAAGQVLVVRQDEITISSIGDLKGKRVAVEWGSGGDVEARRLKEELPSLWIEPVDTPQSALDLVLSGQVDAALVDLVSFYEYENDAREVIVVGEPLTDERFIIVVRPDSYRLLEEINRALLDFQEDGSLTELHRKWFVRGVLP